MQEQTEGLATPRPWLHNGIESQDPDFALAKAVFDSKQEVMVCCSSYPGNYRDPSDKAQDANMRLIVTAVNEHDARVRVCERAETCLELYDNVLRNERDFPEEAAMFDELRAALAALEGGA